MKKYLPRLALLCAGFLVTGTGGSLFVYSNLGSDPLNLMSQGVATIIGLSVGTTNGLIQLLFLLVLLFVGRRRIGVGTVLGIFIISAMLIGWSRLLVPWLAEAGLPMRLAAVFAAPVLIGFGVAMVQLADLGMVPNDVLPLVAYEKLGRFQFRSVRIAYDLTQFAVGVLLGGVFGLGTLISALLTGPSIQFALHCFRRSKLIAAMAG